MVRYPTFKLVQPDDLLVIDITTEGLEPKPGNGPRGSAPFELHTQGSTGLLRLGLPPQQLLEYAADEDGNATGAGRPIFTDPSEVVLKVTSDDPIPTSVEGILDAARRLPLFVADKPSGDPDRPSPNPEQLSARFDVPYVLHLRLGKRSLRLVHDAEVTQHDGRVALWSSEVAIGQDDPGDERRLKVWFDVPRQAADRPTRSPVGITGAPARASAATAPESGDPTVGTPPGRSGRGSDRSLSAPGYRTATEQS